MDVEIRHLSNSRFYSATFQRSNTNNILFSVTFQTQNFEFGMLPIRQNSRGHFPGNLFQILGGPGSPVASPLLHFLSYFAVFQLTQDQVPALVYSSNRLPAVGVSRRERLLSAAYNGLGVAMGSNPHFVGIVHLLPHMKVRGIHEMLKPDAA